MFFLVYGSAVSAIALYVWLRLIVPLRLGSVKNVLALFALVGSAVCMLLVRRIAGSITLQGVPHPVLLLCGFLHASVILTGMVCVVYDLLAIVFRKSGIRFAPKAKSLLLGFGGIFLAVFGMWQALSVPSVRQMDIAVRNLDPAFHNFTIAQLTDVHIGPLLDGDWLRGVVANTVQAKPDLIVITGDLVDGTPGDLAADVAPFAGLKAPYGVFAVLGNHEYYSGLEAWMPEFARLGMRLLVNEHALVTRGDKQLVLAGVTDTAAERYNKAMPNVTAALQGAPEGTRILFDHRPQNAQANAQHGFALQLSGHTHGGLLWPLMPLVARFNGGFVNGLYDVEGMQLYVSPGTGLWAGFPVRFLVQPEITLIRLVPGKE